MYRIPRSPTVPTTKTANGGGPIGYFVDGAAMFNSWDAYTYSTVSNVDAQNITGYWNRDAYVNEGASFDPNNAHQAGGQYHYHANPPALRYQLGDHVDFNSVTKIYTEDTNAPTKHSPILAWTADGYPVYGPYGYSVSNDASSGIRRMISGYVLRNGQYGTDNLHQQRTQNNSRVVGAVVQRQLKPSRPGRQHEFSARTLHGRQRLSRRPRHRARHEHLRPRRIQRPLVRHAGISGGTYAYFVSISSNGTPVFPYNIGRGFYGSPTGGTVTTISETVVTNFLGNTNLTSTLNSPSVNSGTVTLSWSAIEGGTYMVQSTTNFADVDDQFHDRSRQIERSASYTNNPTDNYRFYRVARTAVRQLRQRRHDTFLDQFRRARRQRLSRPDRDRDHHIAELAAKSARERAHHQRRARRQHHQHEQHRCDSRHGCRHLHDSGNATTGAQNIVVTFQSRPGLHHQQISQLTKMNRALKKILLLPLLLATGAGAADLRVDFLPQFNGAPLAFDALKNQTAAGQKISVTRLDFLASDISLRRDDGTWLEQKNWFAYISARDGKTNFTLENIPAGNYNAIRFQIGLPPEINHGDAAQWPAAIRSIPT
jgi:hypothetical protein